MLFSFCSLATQDWEHHFHHIHSCFSSFLSSSWMTRSTRIYFTILFLFSHSTFSFFFSKPGPSFHSLRFAVTCIPNKCSICEERKQADLFCLDGLPFFLGIWSWCNPVFIIWDCVLVHSFCDLCLKRTHLSNCCYVIFVGISFPYGNTKLFSQVI